MKLTPNFTLSSGTYTVMKFPAGEIQVTLDRPYEFIVDQIGSTEPGFREIAGSILSSDQLMELLQLVEAIRYYAPMLPLYLILPYCAYSRQDRRCNRGESFSLKVFANLINSCNFEHVTMYDNHSDVATALIDNCRVVDSTSCIMDYMDSMDNTNPIKYAKDTYDHFVSPDAGANKKVFHTSTIFNIPMIRADKVRDVSTGNIISTDVFATPEQLANKTVLIIDDICAGGRTFVELAKSLKAIEPSVTIHLYVTHGFFSSGLHSLLDAGITKFITTDSVIYSNYDDDITVDGTVTVIPLFKDTHEQPIRNI